MALEKYPTGLRGLDIVIGFTIIFLGSWIILDTAILEPTLVFLLAVGLVFIGFTRLGKGIFMSEVRKSTRAIKIVTGLFAIILAIAALLFTSLAMSVLITLLTFGIMLLGMARLVVGYSDKDIKQGTRILYTVGGGTVFFFGFIAAIFPSLGLFTLKLILAITFLILGSLRVAAGISGEIR
jgi:uncharacterized membrane protein HdeD (DUF308 family)